MCFFVTYPVYVSILRRLHIGGLQSSRSSGPSNGRFRFPYITGSLAGIMNFVMPWLQMQYLLHFDNLSSAKCSINASITNVKIILNKSRDICVLKSSEFF